MKLDQRQADRMRFEMIRGRGHASLAVARPFLERCRKETIQGENEQKWLALELAAEALFEAANNVAKFPDSERGLNVTWAWTFQAAVGKLAVTLNALDMAIMPLLAVFVSDRMSGANKIDLDFRTPRVIAEAALLDRAWIGRWIEIEKSGLPQFSAKDASQRTRQRKAAGYRRVPIDLHDTHLRTLQRHGLVGPAPSKEDVSNGLQALMEFALTLVDAPDLPTGDFMAAEQLGKMAELRDWQARFFKAVHPEQDADPAPEPSPEPAKAVEPGNNRA